MASGSGKLPKVGFRAQKLVLEVETFTEGKGPSKL